MNEKQKLRNEATLKGRSTLLSRERNPISRSKRWILDNSE